MLAGSSDKVQLNDRYGYFILAFMWIGIGVVLGPWYWGLAALLVAGVILYFAERWYARLWDEPRLWWYKFFQGDRKNQ
jgi:hypothetical protein